jgi:hypothetical protein
MTAARAASSASASKGKAGKGSPSPSSDERSAGAWRAAIPMKPHRGLFVALLAVLVVWCGVMVWMYFRALHPSATTRPEPPRATEPAVAVQGP